MGLDAVRQASSHQSAFSFGATHQGFGSFGVAHPHYNAFSGRHTTQTFGGQSSSREFAQITAVQKERHRVRFNGSRETATTTVDMDADIDAEPGDVIDAKTTFEMKDCKDA